MKYEMYFFYIFVTIFCFHFWCTMTFPHILCDTFPTLISLTSFLVFYLSFCLFISSFFKDNFLDKSLFYGQFVLVFIHSYKCSVYVLLSSFYVGDPIVLILDGSSKHCRARIKEKKI